MKIKYIIPAIVFALFCFSQNINAQCDMMKMNHSEKKSGKKEAKATTKDTSSSKDTAKIIYTCPMHPEVISDKPGKCPKCGMDLVEKTTQENPKENMKMKPMGMIKGVGIGMVAMMVVMMGLVMGGVLHF